MCDSLYVGHPDFYDPVYDHERHTLKMPYEDASKRIGELRIAMRDTHISIEHCFSVVEFAINKLLEDNARLRKRVEILECRGRIVRK